MSNLTWWTVNVLSNSNTVAIEYSGDNPIYVGEAKPGTAQDATGWRIKKITYSGDNPTDVKWADGKNTFGFIWGDRTDYTYS